MVTMKQNGVDLQMYSGLRTEEDMKLFSASEFFQANCSGEYLEARKPWDPTRHDAHTKEKLFNDAIARLKS